MENDSVQNVEKSIVSNFIEHSIDTAFLGLISAAGFPTSLVLPFAKGLVLGLVENCYNDCAQRTLSIRESQKLNRVSLAALNTFRELAEQDGVEAWQMNIEPAYFDYAYEVAEHATLEAIKQSEQTKVDILGRYYGRQFYKGNAEWQDMHQMINMTGSLSLRQIVLIRLISEGFEGFDKSLFISNPSACVEVNRLRDYGIWQTEGASWGVNDSWAIQIKSLIPTIFSGQVCKALMLDQLSDNDISRTIDGLHLTERGLAQEILTKDDFEGRFSNVIYGETLGTVNVAPVQSLLTNKHSGK